MAKFSINLQVGLLRVRNAAEMINHSRTGSNGCARWPGNILWRHLTGGDQSRRSLRWKDHLPSRVRRPWRQLVQDPSRGVRTLANSRQGFIGNDHRLLWLRDKQERQVEAVIEYSKSSANDRMFA